jgi:hypothetical protein
VTIAVISDNVPGLSVESELAQIRGPDALLVRERVAFGDLAGGQRVGTLVRVADERVRSV